MSRCFSNGITLCPFPNVAQRSITFKVNLPSFDMLVMPLHCVSVNSVFHKGCRCSHNESSCIRIKFTCIASLFVLETGPSVNNPAAASRKLAVYFPFVDMLHAEGNVGTDTSQQRNIQARRAIRGGGHLGHLLPRNFQNIV